jgi:hypothetical protein
MMSTFTGILLQPNLRRAALALSGIAVIAGLAAGTPAIAQVTTPKSAQDAPPPPPSPGDNVRYGYVIHQSIELGGHIATYSGSDAMYDTLINLQSGPRILDQSLEMIAEDPAHTLIFDHLSTNSFGYGGDPYNVTFLNLSKGRIYDFRSNFRRNRQYFADNLLANPLIPPTSTPFVPILDSPHLYNTVRRMTDISITVAPLSVVSAHFGYFQNVNQGPSNSTLHVGAEALLTQYWRLSTDVWNGGIVWKPLKRTTVGFDEFITHFKGNTHWQLTGLNYLLSNGAPVSLGIDISSVWSTPCAAPFNANGTVNPTCNAFLSYTRFAPTRTLFPSEQFHFESALIPHFTMNGRVLYMGTTSHLTNFNESFNGLDSRAANRVEDMTGTARARRINVNADYGATWQLAPTVALNDIFNFWYFREPATNDFTNTNYAGTSLLQPPGAATATTTTDYQALNQKTKINTFFVTWDADPHTRFSLGYRYSSRIITDAGGDFIPIHANWALVGMVLMPTPHFRANFNVDAMYADNSFTRISPRQLQHYRVRTAYNPHPWLSLNGTINILESRDNVDTVNHLFHNRDFSFATVIAPKEKWSINLSYAYDNIFSTTLECYTATPVVEGTPQGPPVCQQAGLPLQSNGYYSQPTQYGSIGFVFTPVKKVHAVAGYRISDTDGQAPPINVRQVPGSLQSQYQTPYATLAYDLNPNWTWKGDYNYYSYGEGTPIGPTLPRSFRGNVYTLGVRYAF